MISQPLFSDDLEEEIQSEIAKELTLEKKAIKTFHNTNETEFEEYSSPKVDQEYADEYLESYYFSVEYHERMKMSEKLDDYFKMTELGQFVAIKRKIPKQLLPKIYMTMKEAFGPKELSETEFFICVAEYFGMSYDILYENIPAIFREQLVKELDGKYQILEKRGIQKLF